MSSLTTISSSASTTPYIHSLVDDMLLYTFTYLCHSEEAPFDMPVQLGHVSKGWRNLVHGSPQLWTNIKIHETAVRVPRTTNHSRSPRFLRTIYRVKDFLKLSGTMPIDLSITLKSALPIETQQTEAVLAAQERFHEHTRTLSWMISFHLHRVRNLNITADTYTCVRNIHRNFPPTRMPLLQQLEVDVYGDQSSYTLQKDDYLSIPLRMRPSNPNATFPGDNYCPNLSCLRLTGVPVGLTLDQFSPRNLTELLLVSLPNHCQPTWSALRTIFLANENSLDILHLDFAPVITTDDVPFTLKNLASLVIVFYKLKDLRNLVRMIRVPNLEYLSITDGERSETFSHFHDRPNRDGLFAALSLLIEHFPLSTIRLLILSHIWGFPGEDEAMGRGVPDANNLDICGIPFMFFSALKSLEMLSLISPTTMPLNILNYVPRDSDSPPQCLPALQALHLSHFNQHIVRDFIHHRRFNYRSERVLECIQLTIPYQWKDDMYLDIKGLCVNPSVEYLDRVNLRRLDALIRPPKHWQYHHPHQPMDGPPWRRPLSL
ncbi:hypothetical protein C0991_002900 [Blastosporella zonata]|nr:hypothetical protein C0991_002900 [Blastosporella zonata]